MKYYLGVDLGSTASKAVAINGKSDIIGSLVIPFGAGAKDVNFTVNAFYERTGLSRVDCGLIVATGYGRGLYTEADCQVSEITCHTKGVKFLLPSVRTIIDIGGQDSKAIILDADGRIQNFVMNEKCAAGTGRFLEVMSRVLDIGINRLGEVDAQADCILPVSNTCTVFAESEVISLLSQGARIPNIVAGIHSSIAKRVCGLANRVGIKPEVVLTGGVAQNEGVARGLERELGERVLIPAVPQITGALGAALIALSKAEALGTQ